MKIRTCIAWAAAACLGLNAHEGKAQKTLFGRITETTEGKKGVAFARIHWLGTTVGTSADSAGYFTVAIPPGALKLVAGSVGYSADTITVSDLTSFISIRLKTERYLDEVKVEETVSSSKVDFMNPIQTQLISAKELQKAACCNLSESFETSPAVDVSYADALTGAKQIQMLGLSGQYTLLTEENLPGPSGILGTQGLSLIPGPWIQSIQLIKGSGSVANGYESVAGQINVELWKADSTTRPLLNVYANAMKRFEINGVYQKRLAPKLDATLFVHGNQMWHSPDRNEDGYRDMPEGYQGNALLRLRYLLPKGWMAQLGGQWVDDERVGGQSSFHGDESGFHGFGLKSRLQTRSVFGKLGKVFPGARYQSLGFLWSMGETRNHTRLGFNTYSAAESNTYFMAVYQSIIGNTDHQYRVGAGGFTGNGTEELDQEHEGRSVEYRRNEMVPGIFGEYTGQWTARLNAVIGARVDYHNLFGVLFSPRAHFRFEATPDLTLRASVGKGRKLASLVANNLSFLASNRRWITQPATSQAYGFRPDEGWNTGVSAVETFRIGRRRGTATIDYFYTWFQQQVVTDLETVGQLHLYALNGRSFAHSFSAQWDQFITRKLEIRLAYRWVDSRNQFTSGLLQKPFLARNRGFANLAWTGPRGWKLDATLQRTGSKRLPASVTGLAATQSPAFFTLNSQISKGFLFGLELYLGVENLTDFRQKDLILNPGDMHSTNFDAAMLWGPIIGRMVYGGVRWSW